SKSRMNVLHELVSSFSAAKHLGSKLLWAAVCKSILTPILAINDQSLKQCSHEQESRGLVTRGSALGLAPAPKYIPPHLGTQHPWPSWYACISFPERQCRRDGRVLSCPPGPFVVETRDGMANCEQQSWRAT